MLGTAPPSSDTLGSTWWAAAGRLRFPPTPVSSTHSKAIPVSTRDGHLGTRDGHLGTRDGPLGTRDGHLGTHDGHLGPVMCVHSARSPLEGWEDGPRVGSTGMCSSCSLPTCKPKGGFFKGMSGEDVFGSGWYPPPPIDVPCVLKRRRYNASPCAISIGQWLSG